ncbi:MAG: hypothetical protein QE265_10535 [Rhodoferax sp.]|nr:hypothetical protein [Rhodoferax sp.]
MLSEANSFAAPTLNPKLDFGDQDRCRLNAAAQVQAHEIQSVDVHTLGRLKALAGHGEQLLVWSTPEKWLVHGHRIDAIMSVDLHEAALSALTANEYAHVDMKPLPEAVASLEAQLTHVQQAEATALQAVRYLLLLRLGPSARTGRKWSKVSLKASGIAVAASGVIRRMVAIVIKRRLDLLRRRLLSANDTRYFALIQQPDLTKLPKRLAASCSTELRRMDQLCGRGFWLDAPMPDRDQTATVDCCRRPKTDHLAA